MSPGDAILDPGSRDLLGRAAASGAKPLATMQVEEARAFMRASQPALYDHPLLTSEVVRVAGTPVRVVKGAKNPSGAVLYLHGGGWVLGSPETHAGIVQEIALRTGAVVFVPDYPLAPEEPFPAALQRCYAVAKSIMSGTCDDFRAADCLAVVGDSAGGNLAAVIALMAAERGDRAICLQILLCPALSPNSDTSSYEAFSEGFGLTAADMRWFWNHYASEGRRNDWRVSPLHAPRELLSRVAPAMVITAGCDVLRDEAENYAQQLWQAGNQATLTRFPGTIHNFPVIDELRNSPSVQSAFALIAASLNSAFEITGHGNSSTATRTNQE